MIDRPVFGFAHEIPHFARLRVDDERGVFKAVALVPGLVQSVFGQFGPGIVQIQTVQLPDGHSVEMIGLRLYPHIFRVFVKQIAQGQVVDFADVP